MKYGVLLTRAQPFHEGHVEVVKQALSENDRVLIVIGSANKLETERNPFHVAFRRIIIRSALHDHGITASAINDHNVACDVKIMTLADWSKEDAYQYAKEWGNFFYYNVVNAIVSKSFTLYYNDDTEVVKNWFTPELLERITIKHAERTRDVSSTKIREAILSSDMEYLKDNLSPSVLSQYDKMREKLLKCENEDFIMN